MGGEWELKIAQDDLFLICNIPAIHIKGVLTSVPALENLSLRWVLCLFFFLGTAIHNYISVFIEIIFTYIEKPIMTLDFRVKPPLSSPTHSSVPDGSHFHLLSCLFDIVFAFIFIYDNILVDVEVWFCCCACAVFIGN